MTDEVKITPAEALYPDGGGEQNGGVDPSPEAPKEEPKVEAAPEAPKEEPPKEEPAGSLAEGTPPALKLEDYSIAFPEGFDVQEDLLTSFKQASLEAKLDPKAAQSFADLYAKALQTQVSAATAARQAEVEGWLTQINQDPLFQGERRTQSLAVLGMAMKEYGSPEAAEILNSTGLGNHPAVVRYILKLASALNEGSPLPGGKPAQNGGKKSISTVDFYPSMQEGASPRTRN